MGSPMMTRSLLPSRHVAASLSLVTIAGCVAVDDHSTDESYDGGASNLSSDERTIFRSTDLPEIAAAEDSQAVELGVRFRADVPGVITGLRFYKGRRNSGQHVGHLWSSDGSLLATLNFTGETRSGWQTARFSRSVTIAANTTYVASYYAPTGHYPATRRAFADKGVDRGPLHALRDGADGADGAFHYGASAFPTDSYQSTNYFVDVIFKADGATADAGPPPPTDPAPLPPDGGSAPSSLSLRGWQLTTNNIGLAAQGLTCDSLPLYTGPLKPARGSVLRGVRVTGPLDLTEGDITVERSCIRPTSTGYHNWFLVTTTTCPGDCYATTVGNVVIRDSEIDGGAMPASMIAGSCAFLGVGTLQRNYMHGMGSGICFYETGTEHDALAEQNYVTDLRSYGESHNEAATVRDFRKNATNTRTAIFRNNRLFCDGNVTATLFIQPTWTDIFNVTVEGNYFEGGGYNLYVEHGQTDAVYGNIRSSDNRFRSTGWGPSAITFGPGWAEWRENYRYDPSQPDAKGAVVVP